MILQEQSPQRVMEVRSKLYELLTHCIPPTVILKVSAAPSSVQGIANNILNTRFQTITDRIVSQVDESLRADIVHWAALYVSIQRSPPGSRMTNADSSLGGTPENREQEDFPLGSMGSEGHGSLQSM